MYFVQDFNTNFEIFVRIRVVICNIMMNIYDYSINNTFLEL